MNPSGGEIQVVESYGHVRLHCDLEEFVRLRRLIYAETAVADAIKTPEDRVLSVRVTSEPVAEPPPFRWITLVPTMIACCVNGVIMVVGLMTIFRWIMERMS